MRLSDAFFCIKHWEEDVTILQYSQNSRQDKEFVILAYCVFDNCPSSPRMLDPNLSNKTKKIDIFSLMLPLINLMNSIMLLTKVWLLNLCLDFLTGSQFCLSGSHFLILSYSRLCNVYWPPSTVANSRLANWGLAMQIPSQGYPPPPPDIWHISYQNVLRTFFGFVQTRF